MNLESRAPTNGTNDRGKWILIVKSTISGSEVSMASEQGKELSSNY